MAATRYGLAGGTIYTGREILRDRVLWIEGDRLGGWSEPPSADCPWPLLDATGLCIAPGFLDLQLNGCGGVLFNDAIAPATLDAMHEANLRGGVTSFLPTLITAPDDAMHRAMAVVADYRRSHPRRVLGAHLEGPYLNPQRRGIHDARQVRAPDGAMLAAIAAAGPEVVRMLTLAPERTDPADLRRLRDAGIVLSAGHSAATYAEAMAGFAAGIRAVTHLFNAMSPWQSREPGLVGAAFDAPEVFAGIIADGYHVHFASLRLAKALKGDRLFLVTDATPPAGLAALGRSLDSFPLGGQTVYYRDGRCVAADGTLGGSALTAIAAVENCVRQAGIPLPEALRMAATYPARAIGCDCELGAIAPGYAADLVLFDDGFRVRAIVEGGVYRAFDPVEPVPVGSGDRAGATPGRRAPQASAN